MLETAQTRPPAEVPTDPFDWPGNPVGIALQLTQMAHRLLIEEHPLTRPDIRPNPTDELFPHTYTGTVRSWVGVGRFVLGLPGQVKIESPADFRAYVRGRINEFSP